VRDTDGEFMLIEAADHLPRWLNPDTAENRVSCTVNMFKCMVKCVLVCVFEFLHEIM